MVHFLSPAWKISSDKENCPILNPKTKRKKRKKKRIRRHVA
jgi:hypothetical protein